MNISWSNYWQHCKSRLSATSRNCFLGRQRWKQRAKELRQTADELRSQLSNAQSQLKTQASEIAQLEQQIQGLGQNAAKQAEQARQDQPPRPPHSEPPPGLQFDAKIIELALNLSRRLGLRPSVAAMETFFDWMGWQDERVPTYQAIKTWMLRVGLQRLNQRRQRTGATWLVDHTIQVGKEKVLAILCVRPGHQWKHGPLKLEDLELLALVPGTHWPQEEIEHVFRDTVQRFGMPRAIVCDGAAELSKAAKSLGNGADSPIVLRDMKHFLANRMEDLLTRDPVYAPFSQKLKQTCASIQQTELAHFIPRKIRLKSRFMNMGPVLDWAKMTLWHLDHPDSEARKDIAANRFEEKLGWLKEFRKSVAQWLECQAVIATATTLIANSGISKGTSQKLADHCASIATSKVSRSLVKQAVEFLQEHERLLLPGEQLAMSTEILESSFAMYKKLEGQHAKQGFTSLILAYGTLLQKITERQIFQAFASVKNKDVTKWTKANLTYLMNARRQVAYHESRPQNSKRATVIPAMI